MRTTNPKMPPADSKWYNRWWVLLLALSAGFVLGQVIPDCWMNLHSGLNL